MNTLIDANEIKALSKPGLAHNEKVRAAVKLFLEALRNSAQKRPNVLILALPVELLALIGDGAGEDASVEVVEKAVPTFKARKKAVRGRYNFHDMLKAKALPLGIPLQLLRPSTCDPKLRREEKDGFGEGRQRQDDATCAWNFFVALYYKAGAIHGDCRGSTRTSRRVLSGSAFTNHSTKRTSKVRWLRFSTNVATA